MRKEKKLNPVKKLAKKTALRTAYQAQAHAKQAGQEIRGGASGEGPSDNYAQQKVIVVQLSRQKSKLFIMN